MNATIGMPDMVNNATKPNKAILQNGEIRTGNRVGAYLRLSRDEKNAASDSISIQYQRKKLTEYAKDNGYKIVDFYVDDGFSGTNFNRPHFQRMLQDIDGDLIDIILTKDLSRFGRNYVMSGFYRDMLLNDYGVRVLTVDDNFDSSDEDNEIAPIMDYFNELHARQTSKKIKSTRKTAAKNGWFMGSIPPFGYKRSEADRHVLVVDEEAAAVVRRAFELFKNGESARHIADMLNQEGVLTPQEYYYNSLDKPNPYKKNAKAWCSGTVTAILRREVYLGHTVNGKRKVQSYKTKKVIKANDKEWVQVLNTHEPLVDQETFNAVQLMFKRNFNAKPKRTAVGNEPSLFSNLLRCKECGAKLNFNTWNRRGGSEHFYRCSSYIQRSGCTPHRISLDLLTKAVLDDIQTHARLAADDEEAFLRQLHMTSAKEQAAEITRFKKKIAEVRCKLETIDDHLRVAFEKNASGVLSDTMFTKLTQGYEKEAQAIEAELPTLTTALEIAEGMKTDMSKEIANLKRHAKIEELSREIVTTLIEAIYISEPSKDGKRKSYEMEIRYRFNNPFAGVGQIINWEDDAV